jgi:hypothetical protein
LKAKKFWFAKEQEPAQQQDVDAEEAQEFSQGYSFQGDMFTAASSEGVVDKNAGSSEGTTKEGPLASTPSSSQATAKEKSVASTPTPAGATKEQEKWTAPPKKRKQSGGRTVEGLKPRMKKPEKKTTKKKPKGISYASL